MKSKRLSAILAPPVVCIAMLAGMTVQASRHVTPETANPYHEKARVAVESIPKEIDGWVGNDIELPLAAVKLLRPNAVLCRRYIDTRSTGAMFKHERRADLLVVQCRESRDMVGHYPHNCYPSSGWIELRSEPFDGSVDDVKIPATEYHFTMNKQGQTDRLCVYNFLIVPNVGIVPDIKGVEKAAEDYQQRYFGAAQYQVVMDADLPREEREEIYTTFIRANLDTIRTLKGDVR